MEKACRAEPLCQRLTFRRATAGHDDFRALGNEDFRGTQSDAACRTCDHRDFAIQSSHLGRPPF
jgi:hypothetical protein